MRGGEVGSPPSFVTMTPGDFPANTSPTLFTDREDNLSRETTPIAPVSVSFFWVP
ncbi:hypothetical protein D3C81_1289630 [compost metagenome]